MTLFEFLQSRGIADMAALPLEKCRITKERLIAGAPEGCFVVMLVLPYPRRDGKLFASFAQIPDYHRFFENLEKELRQYFDDSYSGRYLKVFADHSPIDERLAACNAGLGVRGDNGLFISEKFGSFVFLGELVCSLSQKELEMEGISVFFGQVRECLHCGICQKECPAGAIFGDKNICVSNLTQKKGDLTDTEKSIIKKSGYVWGCDRCAVVCPMNQLAQFPKEYAKFFEDGTISPDCFEDIDFLSDEEYGKYPFSWRKKDVLKRNFELFEN